MWELNHHSYGQQAGTPVLLLHGLFGVGDDWEPIAEKLAPRFPCLTVDLPGFGQSIPKEKSQPLSLESVTDSIFHFLELHQIQYANVIGYSLGGRIALDLTLRYPGLVRSLVLESANPGIADAESRRRREEEDRKRAEDLASRGMAHFIEDWYSQELFASLAQSKQSLESLKQLRIETNDPYWAARILSQLSPGRVRNMWPELNAICCPVAVVSGSLDLNYCKISEKLAASVANGRHYLIPEAGHNTHFEGPDAFISAVLPFLESVKSPADKN